jgi:SAM-dependent methyltransferase
VAAVDWYLPKRVRRVVDLGAGTGALTRLLIDRADDVVAVEPDDRMREVLAAEVPGARALSGTGEAMPLDDGSVDTVIASTSWHWMDPDPTLAEMARILTPGGYLGALWTGPDPDGPLLSEARARAAQSRTGDDPATGRLSGLVERSTGRGENVLVIPDGVPFDQPEHTTYAWDIALNAEELLGLLSTFSWVITLPDDTRAGVMDEARTLLTEFGIEGPATVDVAWRTDAWRARRLAEETA